MLPQPASRQGGLGGKGPGCLCQQDWGQGSVGGSAGAIGWLARGPTAVGKALGRQAALKRSLRKWLVPNGRLLDATVFVKLLFSIIIFHLDSK